MTTEQDFLEDNIATVAFHLGQPGARLSVSHDGPGLVVDPGEVLKEISRRLSGVAQAGSIPLEATPEMVIAGELAGMKYMADAKADALIRDVRPTVTAEIYRAMVKCALALPSTTQNTPEECSCVGAVIGSHDSSCPYAHSSTDE